MSRRRAPKATRSEETQEPPDRTPRICASCGRAFSWRRAWADCWSQVRYCSKGCRAHRPGPIDAALEAHIERLLETGGGRATICPSEAAQALRGDDWQPLMERARRAARRLVAAGRIEMVQSGRVVDPSTARGPIQLRRRVQG